MDSFEVVVENNFTKLYTLTYRLTGNKEDAEDVLQLAFLNAYKSYDKFRNESSVYTWLYSIVVREARRYMKTLKKMPVDEYADENNISSNDVYNYINSFGSSEDEALAQAAKETCLQLFMNCMPPKYRIVFTLRVILDLSVKDTAEILNMNQSTVKVNLHRARNLIKSFMEGKCSLLNPNYPCICNNWVKYAMDTNRDIIEKDLQVIRQKEKSLSKRYKNEVDELYKVLELYNYFIEPESFEPFKKHIKNIINEDRFKLLEKEK